MNKRLLQGMLLASAVMLTASGCGQKPEPNANNSASGKNGATPNVQSMTPQPTVSPSATPALKQSKVKLYFSDSDQSKLIESEATVSYKKDEDKIGAAFQALKKSGNPNEVSLFADVEFKSVSFDKDKGDLKLDLVFGPNAQLGAPGEELFLQALKKTAFQFPEVKAVYVLKNGKQDESLMGHMELPYPIKRSN